MKIAKAVTRVNVRTSPGFKGKIQKVLAAGDVGVTWKEPVQADEHTWYFLQLKNGETGWAAVSDGFTPLLDLYNLPADFITAVDFTLRWEGGYVFNASDPGGETNFGISKLSYPMLDIKNLTVEQAQAIYYMDYWLPSEAYKYPYPKFLLLFDIAVLCGLARAISYQDLGPLEIIIKQYRFFTGLTSFTVFGKGWTNRTTDLLRVVKEALGD